MSVALRARNLADKLDELERVRHWTRDVRVGDSGYSAKVSWNAGSAVTGYAELRRRVESYVEEALPRMIAQAVAQAEHDVRVAYRDLETAATMAQRGHLRAGDVEPPASPSEQDRQTTTPSRLLLEPLGEDGETQAATAEDRGPSSPSPRSPEEDGARRLNEQRSESGDE